TLPLWKRTDEFALLLFLLRLLILCLECNQVKVRITFSCFLIFGRVPLSHFIQGEFIPNLLLTEMCIGERKVESVLRNCFRLGRGTLPATQCPEDHRHEWQHQQGQDHEESSLL